MLAGPSELCLVEQNLCVTVALGTCMAATRPGTSQADITLANRQSG